MKQDQSKRSRAFKLSTDQSTHDEGLFDRTRKTTEKSKGLQSYSKSPSQSEFKQFEEKLNIIKVKKQSIQLPDSYINGLPDLFEPYKKAH